MSYVIDWVPMQENWVDMQDNWVRMEEGVQNKTAVSYLSPSQTLKNYHKNKKIPKMNKSMCC